MDLIFVPRYMAELTKEEEESNKVKEDWKFVAMVLDRSFVIVINITIIVVVIAKSSSLSPSSSWLSALQICPYFPLKVIIVFIVTTVKSITFTNAIFVIIISIEQLRPWFKPLQTFLVDFFHRCCRWNCWHNSSGEVLRSNFSVGEIRKKPNFCEINSSMQAPSLYDLRPAIDELLSEIQQEKAPIRV